ncbi:MAG: PD40 domain-containing protein [Acidobacteria bacterium]|nr:PD40 domain-containing protein [Acidobacteriota bacterium]
MIRQKSFGAIILSIVLAAPALSQGVMYTGVWPNDVLILDEATGAVKETVKLKHGVAFSLTRSQDRKKFYAVTGLMQTIEVVDIEKKQVIDEVTFSEGNRTTRFTRSLAVHPDGVTLFAPIRTTIKELDRYDIEKAQLAKINIRDKKIEKTLELPREYGAGGLMRVSPDGKFLYVFSRDILIVDVAEFRLVDKILFDRPMYPGLGLFRFGTSFESHDEPNALTFVYNSTDLMTNRSMMGIARFDLRDRSVDFYETGPNVGGSFAVSPDNKRAYIVRNQIGTSEFYVFDLEGKRLLKRQEYTGRPRTSIKVSSDGRRVYLHNAGNTIDYFNAETLQFEKRVELPGDFTTDLFVVPR